MTSLMLDGARMCFPASTASYALTHGDLCSNDDVWLEAISEAVLSTPGPLTYVSAGANKGFNIVHFLRRYGNVSLRASEWLHEQGKFLSSVPGAKLAKGVKEYMTCGRCGGCKDHHYAAKAHREVNVHAFELVPENVAWLRWAFAHFGLRATVVHAAAGNYSGRVPTPNWGAVGFGFERAGVQLTNEQMVEGTESAGRTSRHYHFGRAVRLGEYFEEEEVSFAHVVQIDCENFDGLVLVGMAPWLRRGRVGVVQFEIPGFEVGPSRRPVGNLTLGNILRWMPLNYACFLETRSACLVPIAPAHCGWTDVLDGPGVSGNAVCALEGAYQDALWHVAGRCASWPLEKIVAASRRPRES